MVRNRRREVDGAFRHSDRRRLVGQFGVVHAILKELLEVAPREVGLVSVTLVHGEEHDQRHEDHHGGACHPLGDFTPPTRPHDDPQQAVKMRPCLNHAASWINSR